MVTASLPTAFASMLTSLGWAACGTSVKPAHAGEDGPLNMKASGGRLKLMKQKHRQAKRVR